MKTLRTRLAQGARAHADGGPDGLRGAPPSPALGRLVTGQFIGFGRLVAALDLENPRQPEG